MGTSICLPVRVHLGAALGTHQQLWRRITAGTYRVHAHTGKCNGMTSDRQRQVQQNRLQYSGTTDYLNVPVALPALK